jgi:hypothetical protein
MLGLQRILAAIFASAFALGVHAQVGLKPPAAATKLKAAAKAPQKPAREEDNPGAQAVEKIFVCVAEGLPKDWRRAWVVVTELSSGDKERSFEGKFHYSLDTSGANPIALVPCNARQVAEGVYALNDFLEQEKRQWKVATLLFTSDGKFELKYDYVK